MSPSDPLNTRNRSKLDLVSRVTDRLVATLDFETALRNLIEGATELLQVDRGSILTLDPNEQVLTIRTAIGLEPGVVERTRIPVGEGIAGTVAATGEPIVAQDVRELTLWRNSAPPDRAETYDDFSALCVPLVIHDQMLGVMTFNDKRDDTPFDEVDLEFALLIANQAAIVIFSAGLHEEHLRKKTLERELILARSIQERLLPGRPPRVRGFRFADRWRMCHQVGGDYFDYILLDEDRIALAVGDVAGHGVAAALLMADARASLRGSLLRDESLDGCLFHFNNLLHDHTSEAMYMTLFLGILDATDRSLRYINAGHHPPYRVSRGTVSPLPVTAANLPVGMRRGERYREEPMLHCELDDLLVFYTDGLWEATNDNGERFGDGTFALALGDAYAKREADVVDHLWTRMEAHRASDTAEDDCTVIAVRVC